jgi:hypothetical protein
MENGNGITKADLAAALTDLKTGLKKEIVDELTETMRQIETNLLTEFHRYGKGQQIRLHSLESRDALVTERLAIIEERLLHLESRRPPTV